VKVHDCVQGSSEWLALRAGRPTASQFHRILTPGGKPSTQQDGYLHEIVAEIILGRPLERQLTAAMEFGRANEDAAVSFYEFEYDVETFRIGFVTTDDERIGASPDRGIYGSKNLLEIKCPTPPTHVRYLLYEEHAKEYKPQLQGQLYVCEADWVDICAWRPDMPTAIVRVARDEMYIKLLADELRKFCDRIEEIRADLDKRGWIAKPSPPPVSPASDFITNEDLEMILEQHKRDSTLASG
jgi:hypothetical protein